MKKSMFFASVALWLSVGACATGLPLSVPLEEQKARIVNGDIRPQVLTGPAFLETWGKPTYAHRARMQFYPVKNGNFVPRFRVPVGEVPADWDSTIISEDSYFLGYADRGELLGFIGDRLVYRELTSSATIHEIGEMWKKEALFKTRLETGVPSSPPKP